MASYLNYSGSAGTDTRVLDKLMPLAIERNLRILRAEHDPFMSRMVSSMNVVRAGGPDQLSRDWILRKPVKGSLAGVAEMDTEGTVFGPQVDNLGLHYRHNKANLGTYPNGFLGPRDKGYHIEVSLRGGRSALGVPFADLDVNELGAKIGDDVADLYESWARQLGLYETAHFYAKDSSGEVARFLWNSSGVETYSDSTGLGTIEIAITEGNINHFYRGQMLDLHDTNDALLNEDASNNRVELYVKYVDYINNKMVVEYLSTDQGGSGNTGVLADQSLTNGDVIRVSLRKSLGDTKPGLNTFCKSTSITDTTHPNYYDPSTDFFGFALNDYPEHASFVKDLKGQALSELDGAGVIAEFSQKLGGFGYRLDTAIMSLGAYMSHIRERQAQTMASRDASNPGLLGGGGGINSGSEGQVVRMTFGDMTVTVYLNRFVREDEVYFLKGGDNYRIYAPPVPSQYGNIDNSMLPSYSNDTTPAMQIDAPMQALYPNNKVPVRDANGNVQEGYQHLIRFRSVTHPEYQFPMVKIQNVGNTLNTLSDVT